VWGMAVRAVGRAAGMLTREEGMGSFAHPCTPAALTCSAATSARAPSSMPSVRAKIRLFSWNISSSCSFCSSWRASCADRSWHHMRWVVCSK